MKTIGTYSTINSTPLPSKSVHKFYDTFSDELQRG
jgi:hypothetical protein